MAKSQQRPPPDTENTPQQAPSGSGAYSSSATGGYDHARVASRAYELYMARGGGDGNDKEDWFSAEHELSSNGGHSEGTTE